MTTQNKKRKENISENNIILYTNKQGNIELRADVHQDTLWAKQDQIAQLFEVSIPNISMHLKNIFRTKELVSRSVVKKFLITATDGKKYLTTFYNLDAIIAVGYRVNSKKATQFRMWSTNILRDYLVKGYNLNYHVFENSPEKLDGLNEAVALLSSTRNPGRLKGKLVLRVTKEVVDR